ncbi:MAG: TlpA family protein disulfide reductase [Alphaproteobacteria bacterium]
MIAAGPPANRPPHIGLASPAAVRSRWSRWRSAGWSPGRGSALLRGVAISLLLASTAASAADKSRNNVTFGQFSPVAAPLPAPEVGFTDMEGKPAGFADFRGRPAVVNLWATWCQPCLREMPSLERLQEKLAGRLAVVAISQDRGGDKAVTPFLARLGLDKVRVYLDPKSEVGKAFGVRGLPTSIVLDAEGREIGRVEGEAEWDSAAMLAVLEPLVKTAATPAKDAPR